MSTGGVMGSSGGAPGGSSGSGGVDGGGSGECGIATAYLGDEECLKAPNPGALIHIGPTSYSSTTEVQRYLIQPGAQTTECFSVGTLSSGDIRYTELRVGIRPTIHHVTVFARPSGPAPSPGPGRCLVGSMDRLVIEYSGGAAALPRAPENVGTAWTIPAGSELFVEMHALNALTEPQLREAWIGVPIAEPSTVKVTATPISLVPAARNISPGILSTVRHRCDGPLATVRVLDLAPRMPQYGRRLSAWQAKAGGARNLIYEAYDSTEHLPIHFNSIAINPIPNQTAATGGGYSGILNFDPGDSLEWECEIANSSTSMLVLADPSRDDCALYGSVAGTSVPWSCVGDVPR
jgi:hypothetical protein